MKDAYRSKDQFWSEFIEEYFLERLHDVILGYPDDGTSLNVAFKEIESARPHEAEQILMDPKEWMDAATMGLQRVIHEHAIPTTVQLNGLKFNITNIPEVCRKPIADLRADDRGALLILDGQVRSTKEREEVLQVAIFKCTRCGETIRLIQDGQDGKNFREPSKCGTCETKGCMRLDQNKSVYTNIQEVLLQENIDQIDPGSSPKSMVLRLVEDHIDLLAPGDRCTVTGIYTGAHEKRSRTIRPWVDVTGLKKKGDDILLFRPTKEFEERARTFAQGEPVGTIIDIVGGDIHGHHFEKTAILMAIIGGVRRQRKNGSIRRGDSHILLVGDPGVAKSAMMRLFARIAPRAIFTTGGGTSKAGLTAAAVKDEFSKSGGFALEAGVMVLANMGVAFIDEMDKMNKDDRSAMHEAMEQQTVTIQKAGVHGVLSSMCAVIGAANPKNGRFDPNMPIFEQFDIPDSFATRFDLIIPMLDKKNKDRDAALADHLVELEMQTKEIVNLDFIKQYVTYIKRLEPELTKEALNLCSDYFKTVRAAADNVTARQMEALFRLSEAHAKLHLRQEVTKADAEFAISMHKQYIKLVGHDPLTGEMDLGMISGLGHTLGQDGRVRAVIAAVRELSKGKSHADSEAVSMRLVTLGMSEDAVDKTITMLVKHGRLFHPNGGHTIGIL